VSKGRFTIDDLLFVLFASIAGSCECI